MDNPDNYSETTHFGYRQVPVAEKAAHVAAVFRSVAQKYDVMNDLMSLGLHRLWKQQAINLAGARPGMRVLDLAGGTGDLARLLAKKVGNSGLVVLSDINEAMLVQGRDRTIDAGHVGTVSYALLDAQHLPFPDNTFDRITIGFGLRNVTDKAQALRAIYRALSPGGVAMVLEFSHPYVTPLKPLYNLYSFQVLPLMGRLVANDAASYRYLAESIRMHPDQETLKAMMKDAGFEDCDYTNLSGGIVAVHRGHKY